MWAAVVVFLALDTMSTASQGVMNIPTLLDCKWVIQQMLAEKPPGTEAAWWCIETDRPPPPPGVGV